MTDTQVDFFPIQIVGLEDHIDVIQRIIIESVWDVVWGYDVGRGIEARDYIVLGCGAMEKQSDAA